MFLKENIDAISLKNPELAQELSQIYLVQAEENIEVYSSESEKYVFAYEGLVLDDMVDPVEDARLICKENIPDDFTENDMVVVFGLGTGYLLDSVCSTYKAKIVFYEPKIDILRYAIEFIGFKDVFSLPNLCVSSDEESVYDMVKGFAGRLAVVYPSAYEQLMPDELDAFLSKMTDLSCNNGL